MNAEGFVQLKFDVNEEGKMIDLRVAESEPRLVFDKAAVLYFERMSLDPPKLKHLEAAALLPFADHADGMVERRAQRRSVVFFFHAL